MKTFNKDQVFNKTFKYFKGDILATSVWINKYALKDSNGSFFEESPEDMHKRIAEELFRIESKYPNPISEDTFFELLDNFKYVIPGGSPMSGIGNNKQVVSLSNCYVVGNQYDSYGGICRIDEQIVQLSKRRGGVGTDLSHIRPSGTPVKNSALTSTGIVPFMERYSNSIREVAQSGRRGALLMSCFHPDTYVYTDNGWELIKTVVDKLKKGILVKAWTHEGFQNIIDYQEFDNQDIYEIETENGKTIKVTASHEFVVRNISTKEEYLKKIIDIDPILEELVFYFE